MCSFIFDVQLGLVNGCAIGLCYWMCTGAWLLDMHLDLVVFDVPLGLVLFNVLVGMMIVNVEIATPRTYA